MKGKSAFKAVLMLFSVVLLLVSLPSCSSEKDVVYYGYFGDEALMVIYSREKNTLYEINVPMALIASYAAETGETSVPAAMRALASLNADGFMSGPPEALTAMREIIDALDTSSFTDASVPAAQRRMEILLEKSYLLKSEALLANINTLCNADLTALAQIITSKDVKAACFDAQSFLNPEDPDFSRKYFRSWLMQVIS